MASEDLKKTKEALEAANRELEEFSYSVAHDLRAPIRSILGFSTLVLEDLESSLSEGAKTHLNRVINASKKMGVLIDGLLNLSRLTKKVLDRQSFSLSTMVEEIASNLQSSDTKRKVKFIIASDIIVDGDPGLLKIAINNLLENAWKYSSKSMNDVTIEFGATDQDGAQVLFIRDNGAGFNMKYRDKLFGVFQRLHAEQEFDGNGIGLVTAQRIILRHGGQIWANSEINKGATFYFTISSD